MHIRAASDHSVLISLDGQEEVLRLFALLSGLAGVRNLHPAFASLLVTFNPLATDPRALEQAIQRLYAEASSVPLPPPRTIEIPVCYGGEEGPDLADVAALHGLTQDQVIALHSEPTYQVAFLGFSPGFPYLEGLPPVLATPRLDAPRKRVPPGSVAIGGSHTGIYPLASPGGWRIIGRTPLRLFQPETAPPTLLAMGDQVKFVPA